MYCAVTHGGGGDELDTLPSNVISCMRAMDRQADYVARHDIQHLGVESVEALETGVSELLHTDV